MPPTPFLTAADYREIWAERNAPLSTRDSGAVELDYRDGSSVSGLVGVSVGDDVDAQRGQDRERYGDCLG